MTIGMDEARLKAIQALLIANLSSLNARLTVDASWPGSVSITAAHCMIGDPMSLPEVTDAPMLFCVVGGGRQDALDMETERRLITQTDTSGFRDTLYTNIFWYLHPNAVTATDKSWASIQVQAATREIVRSRACDWLRKDVLNAPANQVITLASREHTISPAYDVLDRCCLKRIYKDYFDKSFAPGVVLYGAHAVHEGRVQ